MYSDFMGRRCIKRIGTFKPRSPYFLSNGFVVLPAESRMVQYGSAQMRQNVSYFVGPEGISDDELYGNFRNWLIFDSFVLRDFYPVYHFDEQTIGVVESLSPDVFCRATEADLWQTDYENIASLVFGVSDGDVNIPVMNYREMFERYLKLSNDIRDKIEWFVSYPRLGSRRFDAIFTDEYWKVLHSAILIEKIIGNPPLCTEKFHCCKCDRKITDHHSMDRRKWDEQYLRKRIQNPKVFDDYVKIIKSMRDIRNSFAHNPSINRSEVDDYEFGEVVSFDLNKTFKAYTEDSFSFDNAIDVIEQVARYLLLNEAFSTAYFPTIRNLSVVKLQG